MTDVDELVKLFEALRVDDGLTADKLEQSEVGDLIDLLAPAGSGEVGLQVLDQLIGKMLDRSNAWAMRDVGIKVKKHLIPRAVRVALAIGEDDEGNPLKSYGILSQRRDWACGEGAPDTETLFYFMEADPRTHARYESYGFRVLARLVIAYAENASFQEAADHELAKADQVAHFAPVKNADVEPALTDAVQLVQEQADQRPTEVEEEPPRPERHGSDDSEAFLKNLPTFRQALSTLRDALTRLEFTHIPDRFRREIKPDQGKLFVLGAALGLMLSLVVLLIVLRVTGVISK